MNAEDRRRLDDRVAAFYCAALKAKPDTAVVLTIRVDPEGHVCRSSDVEVRNRIHPPSRAKI